MFAVKIVKAGDQVLDTFSFSEACCVLSLSNLDIYQVVWKWNPLYIMMAHEVHHEHFCALSISISSRSTEISIT